MPNTPSEPAVVYISYVSNPEEGTVLFYASDTEERVSSSMANLLYTPVFPFRPMFTVKDDDSELPFVMPC